MACHGKVQRPNRQHPDAKEPAVPRILSGVQPTGDTHLGNYVGAKQWSHAAEAGA